MKDEEQLESQFTSLRDATEGKAPPFEVLWGRAKAQAAERPRRSRAWRGATVALAAAAVLLLALFLRSGGKLLLDVERGEELEVASVLDWEPPTDFLLEGDVGGDWGEMPALEFSLPDAIDVSKLTKSKGARG